MRRAIQFSCQLTGLALAVLWLFQTPLYAAIYKWKDDQGKLHFTDSKSKIPLKYRDQMEKFKGVSEPNPEPVEEPEGVEKAERAEKAEKEKEVVAPMPGGGEDNGEDTKPAKKKNLKLIAMLKDAIKFLKDENRTHQRLINFVKPDVQNGRYYIVAIRNATGKKEEFIKKLKGFNLPSLKRARRFLTNTLFQDKQEKIGGEGYLERIKSLKERLEREIPAKKKIIKKLQTNLDEENK